MGTTGPTEQLVIGTDLGNTVTGTGLVIGDATAGEHAQLTVGESNSLEGFFRWNVDSNRIEMQTNGNDYPILLGPTSVGGIFIDTDTNSGNVGIGTTGPATLLDVRGGSLQVGAGTTGYPFIYGGAQGEAATPNYSFIGDTDTGLYRITANILGWALAGAERMRLNSTDLAFTGSTVIRTSTSDASDNGLISLTGGGASGATRGAELFLYGNEHATRAGDAVIRIGDAAGTPNFEVVGASDTTSLAINRDDGSTTFTSSNDDAWIMNSTHANSGHLQFQSSGGSAVSIGSAKSNIGSGQLASRMGLKAGSGFYFDANGTAALVIASDGSAVFTSSLLNTAFTINSTASADQTDNISATITSGVAAATANATLLRFLAAGGSTEVGRVKMNTSAVSYLTSSDRRIKTAFEGPSLWDSDALRQIQVRDYYMTEDNNQTRQHGFFAQELYEAYAPAVSVGGDDPKTNPWTVEYGKLTPLLVAGWQEHDLRIEDLEAQMASQSAGFAGDGSTYNISAIAGGLMVWFADTMHIVFEDGLFKVAKGIFDTVEAKFVKAGKVESQEGYITYDKATGEPYCIEVVNGVVKATKDGCGSSTPSTSSEPSAPAEPTPESTLTPAPEETDEPLESPSADGSPTPTPEASAEPSPEASTSATPEPEASVEPTPEPTPEVAPESTPESEPTPTPEPSPEPTPEAEIAEGSSSNDEPSAPAEPSPEPTTEE